MTLLVGTGRYLRRYNDDLWHRFPGDFLLWLMGYTDHGWKATFFGWWRNSWVLIFYLGGLRVEVELDWLIQRIMRWTSTMVRRENKDLTYCLSYSKSLASFFGLFLAFLVSMNMKITDCYYCYWIICYFFSSLSSHLRNPGKSKYSNQI